MKGKPHFAFTLVELLVALGMTAILAAVLLGLVARTVSLWERSASALMLENEASVVLDHLVTDLETAYRSATPAEADWIAYRAPGGRFASLRLMVLAPSTAGGASSPNTLREVTYERGSGARSGELFRLEGTALDALTSGYAWQLWPEEPAAEFLLAERVEQLAVTFWDDGRDPIATVGAGAWPALARIELTLLSPDGGARMRAIEQGRSNEPLEQVRAETSRNFVRWVALKGGEP